MGVKNKLRDIRVVEYKIDNKSEFARLLEVEIHTYIKWEAGGSPTLEKALEVAKKLDRTVNDIWCLD